MILVGLAPINVGIGPERNNFKSQSQYSDLAHLFLFPQLSLVNPLIFIDIASILVFVPPPFAYVRTPVPLLCLPC